MFKGVSYPRWPVGGAMDAKVAVAAGVLLALWSGGALAQSGGAAVPSVSAAQRSVQEGLSALSLQQAVALALEHNPSLSAARRELEAAQGPVIQGQARPNPELSYSVEDVRSANRTHTWQINVPVELGGKRAARVQAAERARVQAQADLDQQVATVRANVAAAFFEALAAQERVQLTQDSVGLGKAATEAVAKRVLAGKVSPVEESKARVAESSARMEWVQAVSERRNAQARLQAALGRWDTVPARLEGRIDGLPATPEWATVQARLVDSPTMVKARLDVERLQALAELEHAKRVPDVTLSAGVKRGRELERNQIVLGVSVPLPLFDRNQGNVLEALKREEKARDELRAVELRMRTEALQAHEKLRALEQEMASLQREVLPGAKAVYDAAAMGFEYGKFSFLEVLDAQRTYFAAKAQYLQVLTQAHQAAAELDRLMGDTASIRNATSQ